MRFLDEVDIYVRAGNGGAGCRSFLREKYKPRGGPDGGDGGKGGDIILVANAKHTTLLDLHVKRLYTSEAGQAGRGKNRHGRNGRPMYVHVPVGTLIRDSETLVILKDLCTPGEDFTVAKGGAGGRGNARFATPSQNAPEFAETGHPGESKRLRLELKLLADVGIVGFPNAGKSTLVANISSARPRIADYAFTTLVPQLGVVLVREHSSFVIADIPGLIEGASCGQGLGHRFLKHVERSSILLFLIDLVDPERPDPLDAFATLKNELAHYDSGLLQKQHILVFNKIDLAEAKAKQDHIETIMGALPARAFFISARTGEGLPEMIHYLGRIVEQFRREATRGIRTNCERIHQPQ